MSRRRETLNYYHDNTGVGQFLKEMGSSLDNIAFIGMGVGTPSSYGEVGQRHHYFEIDEKIVEIAQNTALFTFISDAEARGVDIEVEIGDGRKLIEKSKSQFAAIVLDAFISSSIPTHLLTQKPSKLIFKGCKSMASYLFIFQIVISTLNPSWPTTLQPITSLASFLEIRESDLIKTLLPGSL